jgi:hypothetical protein
MGRGGRNEIGATEERGLGRGFEKRVAWLKGVNAMGGGSCEQPLMVKVQDEPSSKETMTHCRTEGYGF